MIWSEELQRQIAAKKSLPCQDADRTGIIVSERLMKALVSNHVNALEKIVRRHLALRKGINLGLGGLKCQG